MTLETASRVSLGLGVLSVLAVILAMLALQDIYHGEGNLALEWQMLRVSSAIILVFHAVALIAAWKGMSQTGIARRGGAAD